MDGRGASRKEPASEPVAGVTTEYDEPVRETMLADGTDARSRESVGSDCCGVRIGREGSGGAGCALDMQREGFTGDRG